MKTMVLSALLLTTGFVAGCGKGPCDTLSDICAKCTDANVKSACNTSVATYKAVPLTGDTACQAVLDANTYAMCK